MSAHTRTHPRRKNMFQPEDFSISPFTELNGFHKTVLAIVSNQMKAEEDSSLRRQYSAFLECLSEVVDVEPASSTECNSVRNVYIEPSVFWRFMFDMISKLYVTTKEALFRRLLRLSPVLLTKSASRDGIVRQLKHHVFQKEDQEEKDDDDGQQQQHHQQQGKPPTVMSLAQRYLRGLSRVLSIPADELRRSVLNDIHLTFGIQRVYSLPLSAGKFERRLLRIPETKVRTYFQERLQEPCSIQVNGNRDEESVVDLRAVKGSIDPQSLLLRKRRRVSRGPPFEPFASRRSLLAALLAARLGSDKMATGKSASEVMNSAEFARFFSSPSIQR